MAVGVIAFLLCLVLLVKDIVFIIIDFTDAIKVSECVVCVLYLTFHPLTCAGEVGHVSGRCYYRRILGVHVVRVLLFHCRPEDVSN